MWSHGRVVRQAGSHASFIYQPGANSALVSGVFLPPHIRERPQAREGPLRSRLLQRFGSTLDKWNRIVPSAFKRWLNSPLISRDRFPRTRCINSLDVTNTRTYAALRLLRRTIIAGMDLEAIVRDIDAEISRLEKVRALLTGHTAPLKRGMPDRKRKPVSAEARERIAA